MPDSYADLIARIEALEKKKLGIDDLPMASLQRKLENDWQPDASVLLQAGSLAAALGYSIAAGVATCAFAVSAHSSSNTVVNHGLGVVPKAVIVTAQVVNTTNAWTANVHTITATSFTTWAYVGPSVPGAAVNLPVHWLAIG